MVHEDALEMELPREPSRSSRTFRFVPRHLYCTASGRPDCSPRECPPGGAEAGSLEARATEANHLEDPALEPLVQVLYQPRVTGGCIPTEAPGRRLPDGRRQAVRRSCGPTTGICSWVSCAGRSKGAVTAWAGYSSRPSPEPNSAGSRKIMGSLWIFLLHAHGAPMGQPLRLHGRDGPQDRWPNAAARKTTLTNAPVNYLLLPATL